MDKFTIDQFFEYLQATGYKDLLNVPIVEVDEQVFDHMLGVLPPMKWERSGEVETFFVMECVTGEIYSQYGHHNGRYFHKFAVPGQRSSWICKAMIEGGDATRA